MQNLHLQYYCNLRFYVRNRGGISGIAKASEREGRWRDVMERDEGGGAGI